MSSVCLLYEKAFYCNQIQDELLSRLFIVTESLVPIILKELLNSFCNNVRKACKQYSSLQDYKTCNSNGFLSIHSQIGLCEYVCACACMYARVSI